MTMVDAWIATAAKQKLVRQQIDLGPLGDEEVEVRVEHCGLCHSDLSMLGNDGGWSQFPAVLGHQAAGAVVEVGRAAKGVKGAGTSETNSRAWQPQGDGEGPL
jgi:alcohol/geraniol dehydrogenase (NADP+)